MSLDVSSGFTSETGCKRARRGALRGASSILGVDTTSREAHHPLSPVAFDRPILEVMTMIFFLVIFAAYWLAMLVGEGPRRAR